MKSTLTAEESKILEERMRMAREAVKRLDTRKQTEKQKRNSEELTKSSSTNEATSLVGVSKNNPNNKNSIGVNPVGNPSSED